MDPVAQVRHDLFAEQRDLDTLVAGLDDDGWHRPTPSPRWDVADQIAHLAHFDGAARRAIDDPDGFEAERQEVLGRLGSGEEAFDEWMLAPYRALAPAALLGRWRDHRNELAEAADGLVADRRIPWFGPSMGARSFLTARLMEAWAHGQDVADALAVRRVATDRLHHIAVLGVNTRRWSYRNRGLEELEVEIGVELTAPSGAAWTFGPADGPERIRGTAEDFCLVVTRRRRVEDTSLSVEGEAARSWMAVAQAFAGPPSTGP